jgi:hypothetical protein
MTQKIRLEVPCLKKSWNSIHNQLNVEILTWKNNINYIKDPKQKKIKNKELKYKKIFFIERWNWKKLIKQKEQKKTTIRIKIKIEIKIKINFWLKVEIEKKKSIQQKTQKNNQMNEDQIRKSNIWQIGIEK